MFGFLLWVITLIFIIQVRGTKSGVLSLSHTLDQQQHVTSEWSAACVRYDEEMTVFPACSSRSRLF